MRLFSIKKGNGKGSEGRKELNRSKLEGGEVENVVTELMEERARSEETVSGFMASSNCG